MGYTTRAVERSPGVIEVKDLLIIILLFILIIVFGRQLVSPIPINAEKIKKDTFQQELDNWQPFR
tara:strand:- start:1519 stop:1713 length:195 start_codon:yes stop_codon:yes gene_type:complete